MIAHMNKVSHVLKIRQPEKNLNHLKKIVLLTAFGVFQKIFWLDELNFSSSVQNRLLK